MGIAISTESEGTIVGAGMVFDIMTLTYEMHDDERFLDMEWRQRIDSLEILPLWDLNDRDLNRLLQATILYRETKGYRKYNQDSLYEEMIDSMVGVIENYLSRARPTET